MALFKSDAQVSRDYQAAQCWHIKRAWWPVIVHQGGIVWGGEDYVRALNTTFQLSAFENKRLDDHSRTLIGQAFNMWNDYHRGRADFPCPDYAFDPPPPMTRERPPEVWE